ncbi:hypothetical protein BGZ46_004090 [Entomortierella lignicola]|nr:hypothetical protein BGZ46_004090 [Entomortierella lignicola]
MKYLQFKENTRGVSDSVVFVEKMFPSVIQVNDVLLGSSARYQMKREMMQSVYNRASLREVDVATSGQAEEVTTSIELPDGASNKQKTLQIEALHDRDRRRVTLDKLISDLGVDTIESVYNATYMFSNDASQQVILLQDGSFRYHIRLIPTRWYKESVQDDLDLDVSLRPFCVALMMQRYVDHESHMPVSTYMRDITRVFSSLSEVSAKDQESISRKRYHAELSVKTKELLGAVQNNPDALKAAMTKINEAIFEAKGLGSLDDPDVFRRKGAPQTKRLKSSLEQGKKSSKCSVCGQAGHNVRTQSRVNCSIEQ